MSRPAKAGATDEVRPPRRRLCARPVQPAEGWRLHRCGGIRRSSDARRARTPHAALAEMEMGWGRCLCRCLRGLQGHTITISIRLLLPSVGASSNVVLDSCSQQQSWMPDAPASYFATCLVSPNHPYITERRGDFYTTWVVIEIDLHF